MRIGCEPVKKLYYKLRTADERDVRQLGYPTGNSLKAWCAEFADKNDLRTGYRRQKWQYDDQQSAGQWTTTWSKATV